MSRKQGDIWYMDPKTQIVTNQRTGERAYVPDHDDRSGKSPYKGIPVFERTYRPLVTLDAGHGVIKDAAGHADHGTFSKPGPSGGSVNEDIITLDYAQAGAKAFAARGWDVIVTRTNDTPAKAGDGFSFRLAAQNIADVYFSFHANHAENGAAAGTRLYFDPRADKKYELNLSKFTAAMLALNDSDHDKQRDFIRDAAYDIKGKGAAGFGQGPGRPMGAKMLTSRTNNPIAVLFEVGFISNETDVKNIRSSKTINDVVNELAEHTDTLYRQTLGPMLRANQDAKFCQTLKSIKEITGKVSPGLEEEYKQCAIPPRSKPARER